MVTPRQTLLYGGLSSLTGIRSFEVTESGEDGGVKLLLTIGECCVALTLDSDRRICDINVSITKIYIGIVVIVQIYV